MDFQKKKILIVEDDNDARTIFLDILNSAGFDAIGAVDGNDAPKPSLDGSGNIVFEPACDSTNSYVTTTFTTCKIKTADIISDINKQINATNPSTSIPLSEATGAQTSSRPRGPGPT